MVMHLLDSSMDPFAVSPELYEDKIETYFQSTFSAPNQSLECQYS